MDTKPRSATADIKEKVELFLSYWKWILISTIISVLLGYTYLRYATNEYQANATIKIQEENQQNKLPDIEENRGQGFFSQGGDKIKDQMDIITSRTIATKIVKKLNLNIRCFAEGKIKQQEIYSNPPIKVSFFENDSIIDKVKSTIYLKVKSPTEFIIFEDDGRSLIEDREDSDGRIHAFGDKLDTNYGGIVITPNIGKYAPMIGSYLKLTISPVVDVVNNFQRTVFVSAEKGTSVINLELKTSVAQKAVDYLDQLINEYNKDVLADKEAVVKATSKFINDRLQKVASELEKVDYTAETLQKNNNLTALGSQNDLNLQAKQQIQRQIANTSTEIELAGFLQEELASTDRGSDMLPADLAIGNSNTSQVIRNHNELVAQRDKLLKNSSDKNPIVIQLNNEINTLKANLDSSLENIKQSSELTLNNLNKQNSRILGQLYSSPTKAKQFNSIARQQSIKESLYLYLLQKKEESAIRLGMYTANAKIIDSAYSSYKPVAPNRMIIFLAAFILGLMLPIGLIYIIDLLDTKIYTKPDLVNLIDIPYLGDIPKTSKKEKLIKKIDYSPKAEAFRIVRSNIDFILKNITNDSKKIFVTSTKAQEGKSHTSTNLASSISFSSKSVLLIEMDIRVPKILDYLGLENKNIKGLSDYIADDSLKPIDIIINHPDNKYFDIISSGTIPPNPSELLMSEKVEKLFDYFEGKYDYIIADTSAVGLVSDTLLISKFADMFIYVVSADSIDKRRFTHVAKTLHDEKRLPNMTLLLNGVKEGKSSYGYGYGNNPGKKKKWYNFLSKTN